MTPATTPDRDPSRLVELAGWAGFAFGVLVGAVVVLLTVRLAAPSTVDALPGVDCVAAPDIPAHYLTSGVYCRDTSRVTYVVD